MTGRSLCAAVVLLAMGTSVGAVGLGPLSETGVIDGPRKAFSLTLYNPYAESTAFRAYAVGAADDDETPQPRVTILPENSALGSLQSRRLLVIAHDLQPGETYRFRLCAERVVPPVGVVINARVCSKLSARRLG